MLWLILALVIGIALASAVIGLVAVPARREGRDLLLPRTQDDREPGSSGAGADAAPGQPVG